MLNSHEDTASLDARRATSATYDSADQPYAAIAAQEDGQQRAATEAARRIQLDLAAWLAGKAPA